MTNPIFDDQSSQTTNPLEQYVGPGKKYATVEDLVRGYENGQVHIDRIESENREYREGIQQNILNAQQNRQETPPSGQEQQTPGEQGQRPNERDDLVERIREVTRQEREQEKRNANLQTVTDKLVETFGTPEAANEKVKARASELGVSVKFLMDSATQSPSAFYATMNLDAAPRQVPGPKGDVNTVALQAQTQGNSKPGTYSFYEEMRKTNPRLYNSPKVQLEMHNQAMSNPDFFS